MIHARARMDHVFNRIILMVYGLTIDNKVLVLRSKEMREINPDEAVNTDPADFYLDHEAAQRLLDDLWNMGLRPSDIGTVGHLKAVERHLEDMRKIAFSFLNRVGVE